MRRWILLLLLLLGGYAQAAPPVEVSQELVVSESPLPFGKPAELLVTLEWPRGVDFQPPPANTLKIPEATIIDAYLTEGGGTSKNQAQYHLIFTHFEPGEFQVGPVVIPVEGGGLETEPLSLSYAGAQAREDDKPDQIRDAKKTVELSTRDFWYWLGKVVLSALGVLVLLLILLSYVGVLDRFRSPKTRALRRLKRLTKETPQGKLLESVEVLRDYLAEAYLIPAQTSTSSELLKALTLDNRCRDWKTLAGELLERADNLKFAGKNVSAQEVDDLYQRLLTTLNREVRS